MHPKTLRRRAGIVLVTTAALVVGTASVGGAAVGTQKSRLSGTINIDGSSTVGPLTEVAAELFMKKNPGVRVTVAVSGTSGGFAKFCSGETDGNDASRPIKAEEIAKCAAAGIKYEGVQVANDALSIVVHPKNPVRCLTTAQLKQIWDTGSTVNNWGDITGLTLPASAQNQKITLYGPGSDSGTFDFFTEVVNGKSGQIRTNYTDIGEDDFAAVTAIQGDPWAMGYIPHSFVEEAGKKVKALEIDGGNGCVKPTTKNVQNGTYTPLGRPLFLYASDKALARPEVVAFFEFYNKNNAKIATKATFVPMNREQAQIAADQVARLAGKLKEKKAKKA